MASRQGLRTPGSEDVEKFISPGTELVCQCWRVKFNYDASVVHPSAEMSSLGGFEARAMPGSEDAEKFISSGPELCVICEVRAAGAASISGFGPGAGA